MNLTPFHGPPKSAPHVPGFTARTLLGFGAHGEVWLADELTTGDRVALKVGRRASVDPVVRTGVPPDLRVLASVTEAAWAGVERETALLCRIDHPHIVRLRRVVPFDQAGLALVLDLAAGGSLASLVAARGRLDPGEVSTLLIPLAGALEHLHRRGVVHGDIAPGNVLFTDDGRPQLGDLGVARVLGSRSEQVWSTPGFTDPSPPGGGPVDARAGDLWGLAAVAWFALTGRPPESDAGARSAARDRSPALTELLERCLFLDPAVRPGLDELADLAWQAVRPVPVRLIAERADAEVDAVAEAGLPPLSARITRPAPIAGISGGDLPGDRTSDRSGEGTADEDTVVDGIAWLAKVGTHRRGAASVRRTLPGRGVGIGMVLVGTTLLVAVAVLTNGPGGGQARVARNPAGGQVPAASAASGSVAAAASGSAASGSAASGAAASSASASGSAALAGPDRSGAAVPGDLDTELRLALTGIGRSRAAAFASASRTGLSRADQQGSPAYRADLALVGRLKARGYRLLGVAYDIRGVHVLSRQGRSVQVRAVVTTSAHHQVATASQVSVPVPEDGPRSVVFTVVQLGSVNTGDDRPARWRVNDVRAA